MKNLEVPIWEKMNLTVEEAAAYSNIGVNRISSYLKKPNCPFCLMIGTKRLVKREQFDKFIASVGEF